MRRQTGPGTLENHREEHGCVLKKEREETWASSSVWLVSRPILKSTEWVVSILQHNAAETEEAFLINLDLKRRSDSMLFVLHAGPPDQITLIAMAERALYKKYKVLDEECRLGATLVVVSLETFWKHLLLTLKTSFSYALSPQRPGSSRAGTQSYHLNGAASYTK